MGFLKRLAAKTKKVILLTGTIVSKNVGDLPPQLDLIDGLEDFGGLKEFRRRYINKKTLGGFEKITGAENINELFIQMKRKFYFVRTKKDSKLQLPEFKNIKIEIPVSEGNPYWEAASDPVGRYIETGGRLGENIKTNDACQCVMLGVLRNAALTDVKLPYAIEWLKRFKSETNEKILVFGIRTGPLEFLAETFKSRIINGSISSKRKQEAIDNFQNDPEARMLFIQIRSGGAGINLQAASYILALEQDYAPGIMIQAFGRAHRIGNKSKEVSAYTLVGIGTVDEYVYEVVEERMEEAIRINSGELILSENTQSIESQIAKNFFGNRNLLEDLKNRESQKLTSI